MCREVYDRVYDRWPYYQEGQTCLHIGHLVPLERSNFAMLLGSSGIVKWVTNPLKNGWENANTLAHDGVHLVVLVHLQRRRSWKSFVGEKVNRTLMARATGPRWDGPVGVCWTLMVLGWELCIDPLCFRTNMHIGRVALYISFPKCLRSSKSDFGAKSFGHFSGEHSVTRCWTGRESGQHLWVQ